MNTTGSNSLLRAQPALLVSPKEKFNLITKYVYSENQVKVKRKIYMHNLTNTFASKRKKRRAISCAKMTSLLSIITEGIL